MTYQETSRDAWQSFAPHSPTLDDIIVAVVKSQGGATCEEIELASDRKHQAVSGNLRHLVQRGRLVDSGSVRPTSSGRNAKVWALA